MDNFDLKKYLVENKVTTNSRMMEETQNSLSVDTVNDNPVFSAKAVRNKTQITIPLEYYSGDPDEIITVDMPFMQFEKEIQTQGRVKKMDSQAGTFYIDENPDALDNFLRSLGVADDFLR
jgi:hypothetical protein